jgi:hypothetical protein
MSSPDENAINGTLSDAISGCGNSIRWRGNSDKTVKNIDLKGKEMSTGKSNYNFQMKTDADKIRQIIEAWLTANGFQFQNKFGEEAYYTYDKLYGNRGFQYTIENDMVHISAWINGRKNKIFSLEIEKKSNMCVNSYRDLLSRLFDKLNEVNGGGAAITADQTQTVDTFTKENEAQKEKYCKIGFWISLLALVASFCGVSASVFLYVLGFYMASQGLKTKLRKKAVISIIILCISILILIFSIAAKH